MIYSKRANMLTVPQTIPLDFVGLTSEVSAVIGTGFSFSSIASLGYNRYTSGGALTNQELIVKYINPSSPTFDGNGDPTSGFAWGVFDAFITNNPGKNIQFLLGFPADYLVSTAMAGGSQFFGKSNMPPTDLVNYEKVIKAIVRRAKYTHGLSGCKWTIWGEWDTTGDYVGTVAQMVEIAKLTYQAVKAVDSTAIVLAPSISGAVAANALMTTYLTTTDGAGGNGASWCDGVAMHFYQPYLADTPAQYEITVRKLREAVAAAGTEKPVYLEECGILDSDPNAGVNHARRLFIFAALGVKSYVGFSVDDPIEGYQMSSYSAQWNYAANALSGGKTMTACYINTDGTIGVKIDGITYTI